MIRTEHRDLAFQANRRTRNQRCAMTYTGGIDGKACGEVVAAIEHHVGARDFAIEDLTVQALCEWLHLDVWIKSRKHVSSGLDLERSDRVGSIQDLTL